jgi:heme-degrading monooxygenase HmoA
MAVKVIIERKVKEGKQTEMMNLMRELRALALYRKGYISGETLRSRDDPSTYIVISNWQSVEDWEAWRNHSERIEMKRRFEPILVTPEKYGVFLFVYP